MPTDVIMPALGVAQEKGTLLAWRKAEGQTVKKGEPLMEIETDKATVEIEAPASGTLAQVSARAGDEIPVGETIAVIFADGEALPTKQKTTPAARHELPLPQGEGKGEGRPPTSTPPPSAKPAAPTASVGGRLLASPAAKRLAREKGIALASLRGSGPEGSILAEDVLRAAPDKTPRPAAAPAADRVMPLSPMRRIVGQRMTQSKQSAPHFYIGMDIDMSAVSKLRADRKESGDASIPSINDFILHACARAVRDFPSINSSFTEQGIQQHRDINIGVAVALEEGLVVPVIRNADRLSLPELAAQSRALAEKAQNKKLFPLDYEGGTFTVSNLGMLGVDSFTAIINPPQCAILAVGRVAPRVVADDGMFAIKPTMTATLSADHRVVDGAIAARFLQEVKQLLENGEF
jgi:pyruvate dehydrogenase E2 component (dihydrolipoamide acetyltransferase)